MTHILAFPGLMPLGDAIAKLSGAQVGEVDLHRFPDGESLVTLPGDLAGKDVAVLATLRDPDPLALPLRFAAETAKEMGARRVGLITPYLAYMRQDQRFAGGQAVSAPLFARFLEESFDWVVTADPHLHRIHSLEDLFDIPVRRIETAPLLAGWIAANVPDAMLLGPDSESRQWVAEVARLADRPYEVLEKRRSGDRSVEVSVPHSEVLLAGTPVILDDIVSSGRTLIEAIERLLAAGARPPICVVIHAVFAGNAHDDILAAGAARVVTTNSIPHASNAVSLAQVLADAARDLQAADPPIRRSAEQTTR
ncbi:ribose-phosphate diphosphokinase [Novosphingobium malaysiense]|nr:ribose-phosphate diphosphokinase [Novosphingobium malaysiense]MCP5399949.1 ribose-phosphate diphosphokinase [Sphingomonas sp.]